MKKNITYFIGAGASYHSLPLIKDMGDRMRIFKSYLEKYFSYHIDQSKAKSLELFISELDNILIEENQSTSIDAYARELSNSGRNLELNRLKVILSCYIIFEQLAKPDGMNLSFSDTNLEKMILTSLDKRYRTFWGNYVNGPNSLPSENVKVLSWNYDMQFEFSYSKLKQYSLSYTQQDLQVFPSHLKKIELNKFCLIKINGTAGLYAGSNSEGPKNLFDLNKHKLDHYNIEILIDFFNDNYRRVNYKPVFYFAWEKNSITNEVREYAKEILNDTNILVIIGYSFPTFNREIDRELFKGITKLDKVYYQAPKYDLDSLIMKLEGINPILKNNLIPIDDLFSFHIPNEY